MARQTSKDMLLVMLGGYDCRPDVGQLSIAREWLTEAFLAGGETVETNYDLGISRMTIDMSGLFDLAVDRAMRGIIASETAAQAFIANLAGATAGSETAMAHGLLGVTPSEPVQAGGLVQMQVQFRVSGRTSRKGKLLKNLATVTADGNVVLDLGADPAGAGLWTIAMVNALELGTATALVLTVAEGDSGTGPWTTVTTSTFDSDTLTSQADSVEGAGTVGRYIKLSWTWTGGAGGGSTAGIAVAAHIL